MERPNDPPKLPLKFLRWFCREDHVEEVEGNLIEIFEEESQLNAPHARRQFIANIIRHFRPEYLKLFHNNKKSLTSTDMIFSYIKLAFRNLRKRPSYSFINIFGLALGVCACLLILNYIDFETSYDTFHVNKDQLFRVKRTYIQSGERNMPTMKTTWALGPTLKQDIPEIKRSIRTHEEKTVITRELANGQTSAFHEDHVLVTDSTFFHAFTFSPIFGDLTHSLDNPNSLVLTETLWHKYFGYQDPIGKTLRLSGGRMDGLYNITAVIKDVPGNSHFFFDMVVPMHNIFMIEQYKNDGGWGWNNFTTYVELNDPREWASVQQKFPEFEKRWLNPTVSYLKGEIELELQPIRNIHLEPGLRHDVETMSRSTIYFFGLIAVFILFIAWINYVNLSTARALERSREVGIKKTIGAVRGQLIAQFLCESFVINMIAIFLAVLFASLLIPVLSSMIGKDLPSHLNDIRFWGVLLTLFVAGTLASGMYPAFVLSSFKITKAIQRPVERGFSLRKGLVVFQFVSSIVLIAGTFVVYRQINFMQSQDTGAQMDQMLIFKGPGIMKWEAAKKVAIAYKDEARKIPGVEAIATSGAVPSQEHNWGADMRKVGAASEENTLASIVYVDPDFIPTYRIQFASGHNFNLESASDMNGTVINEAAVAAFKLGTNEEAIGQQVIFGNDTASIIGVVKNFNWNSLKSDYTPFVMLAGDAIPVEYTAHLSAGSIQSSIEALSNLYKDLMPGEPFEYRFLDDTFNMQYKSDQQFGNIFGLFAALAIAICCLGLWGLASFTTSQKLKEIGIRKVLGAPVASILVLLVRQFLILICVSAVIAIPLAWYGMDSWLDGFAFKIGIGWELFAVPIMILTTIALLTVGLQVRRGVTMNPVDVLKTE